MSGIDTSRLAEELNALLERGRIVTWVDQRGEYTDDLKAVQGLLKEATLISIDANLFETKLRIFAEDTKSRFVLYRHGQLPSLEDDLLADVRCGYPIFTADAATLLVRELGVDPALAVIVDKYEPFFKSKARVADLKKHLAAIDDVDKRSDQKTFLASMSAVLLKISRRSFSDLFTKLAELSANNDSDPLNKLKWGLDEFFWEGSQKIWKYEGEHTFNALMTWLFVMNAKGWDYQHNSAQRDFTTWLHNGSTREYACAWAKRVDSYTGASEALQVSSVDALLMDTTTPGVDRELLSRLIPQIIDGSIVVERVEEQRDRRREGLWYEAAELLWEAAYVGVRLLTTLRKLSDIIFADVEEGFLRYSNLSNGLWNIDQYYRQYLYASQKLPGEDIFIDLNRRVEVEYRDRYLRPLSRAWDKVLRDVRKWEIPNASRIDSFHKLLLEGNRRKTAVVISDALRYEIGVELADQLRSRGRGVVNLSPWYTMLPSITALGMAALLPHHDLAVKVRDKDIVVEADGQSTSGIENRRNILSREGVQAFSYDELKDNSTREVRSKVKGISAVYIYHNTIDATGDHAASEDKTPSVVKSAIRELTSLVDKLISADITRILIAADHGFLYQDSKPSDDDTEKQGGDPRGESISLKKRRYILGNSLQSSDDFVAFDAKSIGLTSGPSVALPYGDRRIRIQGSGDRFVHGGAALQEITIPVIEVTAKESAIEEVRDVSFSLFYDDSSLKFSRFSPRVIQEEPVSPTRRVLTITVRVEDLTGEQLSSSREIVLDAERRMDVSRRQNSELILNDGVLEKYSGQRVRIVAYKTINANIVGEPLAIHELSLNYNGFGGLGGFDL